MGLIKTFIAIGIALVFAFFVGYGLYVFYPAPAQEYTYNACYEQYPCYQQYITPLCDPYYNLTPEQINTMQKGRPIAPNCYEQAYANPEFKACEKKLEECNQNYEKQTAGYSHARNSFIILWMIALLAIVGGYLLAVDGVSAGLIGGGILTLLWSLAYTARYWLTLSKYVKFIALGIALALLIYFGIALSKKQLAKKRNDEQLALAKKPAVKQKKQ